MTKTIQSFVVSLLVHKMRGGGGGRVFLRGGVYFNLRRMGGALIRRGRYSRGKRGAANSRIYGTKRLEYKTYTLIKTPICIL